ncbi:MULTISPECIES: DUF397 domain-containing protein [unclassified Streptomyces]|uniref:DUF397 domain-containing protein n=1 Tax=unclassified Streptomyces TaxID=2593676 RepID=UPI0033C098AE
MSGWPRTILREVLPARAPAVRGEAVVGPLHPGWRRSVGGSWAWRKSSASQGADTNCVEVAWTGEAVLVRDSVRSRGRVVALGPTAWCAFLDLMATPSPRDTSHPSHDTTARA